MPTFLLTWNPKRWAWANLQNGVRRTKVGKTVDERWSTGRRNQGIQPGDRVFLLKQGREPSGVMAAGVATSECFLAPHWDPRRRGQQAWFVDVVFDSMLDPDVDPLLRRDELEHSAALASVHWNTQSSGIRVAEGPAKALEERWRRHLRELQLAREVDGDLYDTELVGHEGRLKLRMHKVRERNPMLREAKKSWALRKYGELRCAVCNFVFERVYGSLGEEFIECHHTKPVSELEEDDPTRLRDLALVCSNCHRMIHRGGLISIKKLRALVSKTRRKQTSLDRRGSADVRLA
ncbi:MAG TPA: HNH endonuclease [Terriglobia bacterium]|nr:HNH endonuclease [Terriglobia bacterium]